MARKRGKGKSQGFDFNSFMNSAIQDGLGALTDHHPRFKDNQDFMYKHLDKGALSEKANELYEKFSENPSERNLKKIYDELAGYVASGVLFDDLAKEVVLKNGLEESVEDNSIFNFFGRKRAKRTLEGEKYFDKTIDAFQDLYQLFQSGNYSERMPELAEAASTVNDMGFLDPAVDVLKHYGLINKEKYGALKKGIRDRAEYSTETMVKGIENYINPETYRKAAAFLSGIFGLGLILTSENSITGAVIGSTFAETKTISGILLILLGMVLFTHRKS